jgi:hypothetical protein
VPSRALTVPNGPAPDREPTCPAAPSRALTIPNRTDPPMLDGPQTVPVSAECPGLSQPVPHCAKPVPSLCRVCAESVPIELASKIQKPTHPENRRRQVHPTASSKILSGANINANPHPAASKVTPRTIPGNRPPQPALNQKPQHKLHTPKKHSPDADANQTPPGSPQQQAAQPDPYSAST